MRRRITRALFTAAAAGATITSLSFAAAGPASAAQSPAMITTESAGWAAGNILVPSVVTTASTWNFRYASGTTTVPDVTNADVAANDGDESFVVMLANLKAAATAQLYYTGTAWNVQFEVSYADSGTPLTSACANTYLPGRQARLDVYYNAAAGAIQFTAYDGPDVVCTASMAAWTTDSVGGGSFREAYAGGVFTDGVPDTPYDPAGTSAFTRPSADLNLFPVTGVRITSYNGTMASVSGPWTYRQLEYGTSTSNLNANAPTLWNGGQNFGVWLRA